MTTCLRRSGRRPRPFGSACQGFREAPNTGPTPGVETASTTATTAKTTANSPVATGATLITITTAVSACTAITTTTSLLSTSTRTTKKLRARVPASLRPPLSQTLPEELVSLTLSRPRNLSRKLRLS